MSTFENILEDLKKKYRQEYGVAVFDIEAKNTKSGIMTKGKVLTENQRDEVLREFKKNKINEDTRYKMQGYKIVDNIKILSDANERNEIGWAVVKNKIIDLRSRFVLGKILNEKVLNRIRCSQALKNEVLRVLYKYEDQFLVQQSDLTLGWVNKNEVIVKKKSLYKEWRKGDYALKGKVVFAKKLYIYTPLAPLKRGIKTMEPTNRGNSDNPAKRRRISVCSPSFSRIAYSDISGNVKIIKEAEKYLGVKYVLGGKSKNGIDCSGLVQLVYKNSLGIILPKHSWDQKEMGVKIKLENVKTGDLIFLIKKKNGHKHVGIAEAAESPQSLRRDIVEMREGAKRLHSSEAETMEPAKMVNLIHASLNKKKVVRQKLEEVFESHNFVEARRVAE